MNMTNQYRRAIREKLNTLGRIVSETDSTISVMVNDTEAEAFRRAVQLLPTSTDIKVSPREEGVLVSVDYAHVTTLNESARGADTWINRYSEKP